MEIFLLMLLSFCAGVMSVLLILEWPVSSGSIPNIAKRPPFPTYRIKTPPPKSKKEDAD